MPSTQIALRVAQTDDEREAWRSVRIAVEPNDRVASVRELRAWRGRGLGTALKIRELAWASRNGIRECVTWTQRGNEALQGVNNRLGYTVRSISVSMRRELA